jgi:hypothetical protein
LLSDVVQIRTQEQNSCARNLADSWSDAAELCYLGIVFNQLYYANVLSTVLPVSLFTWGIWIRPWPSAEYWTFVTLYLEAGVWIRWKSSQGRGDRWQRVGVEIATKGGGDIHRGRVDRRHEWQCITAVSCGFLCMLVHRNENQPPKPNPPSTAAMCVKYIFQLDCWSFNDPAQPHTAWWVPVIGIQKVTVGSFARSELVDLVLLLLLIGHRHVSQILATWDYSKLR